MFLIMIFAVVGIMTKHIWGEVRNNIADVLPILNLTDNNYSVNVMDRNIAQYTTFVDGTMVLLIMAITLFIFITSFILPSSPIFFTINVLMFVFLIIISMLFSALYTNFTTTPSLSATTEQFGMMNMILQNLQWIAIFISTISLIVMFTKSRTT